MDSTMMYVTYEQAQALKNLGFSEKCDHIYIRTSEESNTFIFADWKVEDADYNKKRRPQLFISAPRIDQAHDWLISKGYFIAVEWYSETIWRYGIYKNAKPAFFNNTMKPSYREIMLAAITEALKLVERDELV